MEWPTACRAGHVVSCATRCVSAWGGDRRRLTVRWRRSPNINVVRYGCGVAAAVISRLDGDACGGCVRVGVR